LTRVRYRARRDQWELVEAAERARAQVVLRGTWRAPPLARRAPAPGEAPLPPTALEPGGDVPGAMRLLDERDAAAAAKRPPPPALPARPPRGGADSETEDEEDDEEVAAAAAAAADGGGAVGAAAARAAAAAAAGREAVLLADSLCADTAP